MSSNLDSHAGTGTFVWASGNGGAIVRDFHHGEDHIVFEDEDPNAKLTHSGDIWTVHADNGIGPVDISFEIAGITSLSASEYETHFG